MSLFVLQLFIISVLGLVVQSAPVDLTKRSSPKTLPKTKLYHSSRALYNAAGRLRKAKYNLTILPEIDIDTKTKDVVSCIYNISSDQCKNYAKVMSLKHQLQDHLFNTDTALNLNAKHATDLSIILASLQTMANTFNYIKSKEDNRMCVQLAPAQYKIMYHVPYTSDTPLLQLLQNESAKFYLDFI